MGIQGHEVLLSHGQCEPNKITAQKQAEVFQENYRSLAEYSVKAIIWVHFRDIQLMPSAYFLRRRRRQRLA